MARARLLSADELPGSKHHGFGYPRRWRPIARSRACVQPWAWHSSCSPCVPDRRRVHMNEADAAKDKIQGKLHEVKGAATGDTAEEVKGKMQGMKGDIKHELNKVDQGVQREDVRDEARDEARREIERNT